MGSHLVTPGSVQGTEPVAFMRVWYLTEKNPSVLLLAVSELDARLEALKANANVRRYELYERTVARQAITEWSDAQ